MEEKQRKCLSCGNTEFLRPISSWDAERWQVVPEDRAKWKDPISVIVEFETLICTTCGFTQTYAKNLEALKRVWKTR